MLDAAYAAIMIAIRRSPIMQAYWLSCDHYITISLGWMPVIFDFFFKKLLKVYLPTPFCKFFSQKWNIPSLIASFRGHLDGTFAEKFIFLLITRGDLKNVRWFFFNQKRNTDRFNACHISLLILKIPVVNPQECSLSSLLHFFFLKINHPVITVTEAISKITYPDKSVVSPVCGE